MNAFSIRLFLLMLLSLALPACNKSEGHHVEEHHNIVATSPVAKDVVSTQEYVCQIHSRRHIEVRAQVRGYLEQIDVQEGQAVNEGEMMFKIQPTLYQAILDADKAEANLARIEYVNTQNLKNTQVGGRSVVATPAVAMAEAKYQKAEAQVEKAKTELSFTEIKAKFDGIIDRLYEQQGSLIDEGDILTTLSDNDVMWVYFNVPEARYLEYMTSRNKASRRADTSDDDHSTDVSFEADDDADADDDDNGATANSHVHQPSESQQIELVLADGSTFPHAGQIAAIEGQFNNETGNIPFRADFPNPDHLLRHGQTGNVLIKRTLHNAIVIPQRAVFEILDKRFVFVVDEDGTIHQREIIVDLEQDDIFIIKSGLDVNDKFVLEGVRQVRDGETVEYKFLKPDKALSNLKYHAE